MKNYSASATEELHLVVNMRLGLWNDRLMQTCGSELKFAKLAVPLRDMPKNWPEKAGDWRIVRVMLVHIYVHWFHVLVRLLVGPVSFLWL